ncbi:MAG: bifunctional phosphopantothenoylcysteine decarboxylase/phosphopantothenate--cysteine ligase CoaBC [Calditrichaeota bacterium]|nr:MAG: bifunctional phosphopantothenoylcysteine decarboxylase/phosphopantothenate--cysteine ligase CoaBC [Calditrichota bacterium]
MAKLKEVGYAFVDPEFGALATSAEGEGWGRLADLDRIVQKVKLLVLGSQELAGKKVLVTAGPTREPIDPVRFLTNYSSGKMGFALAEAAMLRGASVVLITGPNHLPKIEGVRTVEIETARELKAAVEREYPDTDILLMAAAVADYEAKKVAPHKLKKSGANLTIELQRAPDILASLGKKKVDCIHVGFALETEKGHANALKKLHAKNLDLIVLNNQLEAGAGFAGDTNVVSILTKDGQAEKLPQLPKSEVAEAILDRVCALVQQRLERVAAG